MIPSTNISRINERKARCHSTSERVARLTPSLLGKGFRGELVGQDPSDESAVELLEMVRKGNEKE